MKKLLLPIVMPIITLAMVMLPVTANAASCRNSMTGKFAKCGSPGAVPASQYVAKGKSKMASKSMAPAMTPAATPTKSSMMSSMMHPMAKSKAARCKTAKGKFVKCGTPGAMPAA